MKFVDNGLYHASKRFTFLKLQFNDPNNVEMQKFIQSLLDLKPILRYEYKNMCLSHFENKFPSCQGCDGKKSISVQCVSQIVFNIR